MYIDLQSTMVAYIIRTESSTIHANILISKIVIILANMNLIHYRFVILLLRIDIRRVCTYYLLNTPVLTPELFIYSITWRQHCIQSAKHGGNPVVGNNEIQDGGSRCSKFKLRAVS